MRTTLGDPLHPVIQLFDEDWRTPLGVLDTSARGEANPTNVTSSRRSCQRLTRSTCGSSSARRNVYSVPVVLPRSRPNFGSFDVPTTWMRKSVPAPCFEKNGSIGFNTHRFQPVIVSETFA